MPFTDTRTNINEESDKNLTNRIEKDIQHSTGRGGNFLYKHKKFDILENSSSESDEIRSSKSAPFTDDEESSVENIPVNVSKEETDKNADVSSDEIRKPLPLEDDHYKTDINEIKKEEERESEISPVPTPSNDEGVKAVEEDDSKDKGWILDIENFREIYSVTASPEFKSFPNPLRIDFDYASTLPRLNTVANFEEKSIVIHHQKKDTSNVALTSSDYETDAENSSVKLQDLKDEKDLLPSKAKGAPYYFNTVKSNFREKKLISYIPRPTLGDTSRDFRDQPPRKQFQLEEERKNELRRIKQEELKICNTNLG